MAIPFLGIAGGLLVGAALGGLVGAISGRSSGSGASSTNGASNSSSISSQPSGRIGPSQVYRPPVQTAPSQGGAGTTTTTPTSTTTVATPQTLQQEATELADTIIQLPVFTPTAPEPVVTSENYTSTKRLEVQKSKAGEQTLRNPLDSDQASSAIDSNLPSIGVSASGLSGLSVTRSAAVERDGFGRPQPILRRGVSRNAR